MTSLKLLSDTYHGNSITLSEICSNLTIKNHKDVNHLVFSVTFEQIPRIVFVLPFFDFKYRLGVVIVLD